MSDIQRTPYRIYDPKRREWLAADGQWTKAHRDAVGFADWNEANAVRRQWLTQFPGVYVSGGWPIERSQA